MFHLKAFTKNGLSYSPMQEVNGGTQWRCDYPDGESATGTVYESRYTRNDVVACINAVNATSDSDERPESSDFYL